MPQLSWFSLRLPCPLAVWRNLNESIHPAIINENWIQLSALNQFELSLLLDWIN